MAQELDPLGSMLTFTVHKVTFWTLAINNSGKNSTTKGTLIYSRLHAGATAVVQLFLLVFTRAILLSITTKSSSAKLYFFFDLAAPYCHKKSLESNTADTFYEVLDITLLSDLN